MFQEILASGSDVIAVALCVNVFTALVKIPIKKIAARMNDGEKLTRFITLLPLVFGFAFTAVARIIRGVEPFGDGFIEKWLSASSISLAFYAIFEKFMPSGAKTLTANETAAVRDMISCLSKTLMPKADTAAASAAALNAIGGVTAASAVPAVTETPAPAVPAATATPAPVAPTAEKTEEPKSAAADIPVPASAVTEPTTPVAPTPTATEVAEVNETASTTDGGVFAESAATID